MGHARTGRPWPGAALRPGERAGKCSRLLERQLAATDGLGYGFGAGGGV